MLNKNLSKAVCSLVVIGAAAGCGEANVDSSDGIEGVEASIALGTYKLVRKGSGKCVDVAGAGTADGTNIQQAICNGSAAQSFRLEQSAGAYRLVNTNSNKCVDIKAAGTANGTNVQLWTCNGSAAQTFRVEDLSAGYSRLINPHSNKCVDVSGNSAADGANIQIWTCNGTDAQSFQFTSTSIPPVVNSTCKRGAAYGYHSVADMQALSKGVKWWYNWSPQADSGVRNDYARLGFEFVPMIWDERFDENAAISNIPQGARTLLGFNEPNFFVQANLSPAQAAAYWPSVQRIAAARGLKIASPAVNYCGGGCWDTDPFAYLDKFFAACANCKVDYLAVHWYACTVEALRWYIGAMKKYNRPIWLTEFACGDGDTSLANQKAYMNAAVSYLESEPAVMRYAWFSGRTTAIPNVNLLAGSGVLTELGQQYVNMPSNCTN